MLKLAQEIDKKEGEVASLLYERTIDYGAHPNEGALMQNLQVNENPENVDFKMFYVVDNIDQLKWAMKTTAQIGVCSLSLFRSVYRERFDILAVTDALNHIKKGL